MTAPARAPPHSAPDPHLLPLTLCQLPTESWLGNTKARAWASCLAGAHARATYLALHSIDTHTRNRYSRRTWPPRSLTLRPTAPP